MGGLQDYQHEPDHGRFTFLSYLWQPDIEIHHVRNIREMKVMGQFMEDTTALIVSSGHVLESTVSQVFLAG